MNAGGVDKACKSTVPHLLVYIIIYDNKMYYVYIIKSAIDGTLYCGSSGNLRQRIKDHNRGKSRYTSRLRPWKLVYYEAYASKNDAILRERKLKKNKNVMAFLKKRIAKSIDVS